MENLIRRSRMLSLIGLICGIVAVVNGCIEIVWVVAR